MKCPFKNLEQFAEFVYKLNQLLPDTDKSCDHTLDKTNRVLKQMGFGGLARIFIRSWLNKRGGHCDCEVMLNVVPWNERGGIDAAGWRAIQ